MNDREDCSVGTDAEGQREDRREGEKRTPTDYPKSVPDVLQQLLEPNETPHLARVFLDSPYVAELAQRRVARFFRRFMVGSPPVCVAECARSLAPAYLAAAPCVAL